MNLKSLEVHHAMACNWHVITCHYIYYTPLHLLLPLLAIEVADYWIYSKKMAKEVPTACLQSYKTKFKFLANQKLQEKKPSTPTTSGNDAFT